MRYRGTLNKLLDGTFHARCNAAPNGVPTMEATDREHALNKMRNEIRYQLEWCPCSGVSNDYVVLDVVEQNGLNGRTHE